MSRDLQRVLELPRRPRPSDEELARLSQKWSERLGKKRTSPCRCAEYKRLCPFPLLPVQAWAIEEMSLYGGAMNPIGVGDGKTLLDLLAPMVVPNTKVAVLFVLANLRSQLIETDWDFYEQHWTLPNRAGARWLQPGVPVTHVVAYSELSSASNTNRLNEINPDLVIGDEIQALRNSDSARGKRFNRFMREHPNTRLVCWSGTLTDKSLLDYAHFAEAALGDGSPTPHHYPVLQEWAAVLDPVELGEMRPPAGELERLRTVPGETMTDAWRRRLTETPGIVSSPENGSCKAALYFHERPAALPDAVRRAYDQFRLSWEREDGERVVTGLDKARYLRQLASGLYTRWRWPRNEPLEVRAAWIAARKEWHREMGEKLKLSKEFMDSPLLLAKAAIRWHDGYVHIQRDAAGKEVERQEIPPHTKNGPMPAWASSTWQEWARLRYTAEPETEAVWIDDYLAQDCAAWAKQHVGIIWYEHAAFGPAVAKLAGIPWFGPGKDADLEIQREAKRADRSIVCSVKSHGTGKNLQAYNKNLFANPPSSGAAWEQALGRTHRNGQLADEVNVWVYRHVDAMTDALDKARMLAGHIQGTFGGSQKLLRATYLWKER